MSYTIEHPAFDRQSEADCLIAAGWQDKSWRNDQCPRFHCGPACLWLDYASKDNSEVAALGGEAGQCSIEFLQNGQFMGGEGYAFDTVRGALAFLYLEWIGHNPFIEDTSASVASVAQTLSEYAAERWPSEVAA